LPRIASAPTRRRLTTADGPVVFLATKGPLFDDQGRVAGLFGISRDISQRQAAEAALRESEATMRTLLAAMADGMFVAQDERFVFANAALPRMLGHAEADFIGLPFADVVAPDFLDLWTERFRQRVGGGDEPVGHYELQFQRRDGSPLWVELRASRFDYRGRRAVLGLISDITQRRQAEQNLREASEAAAGGGRFGAGPHGGAGPRGPGGGRQRGLDRLCQAQHTGRRHRRAAHPSRQQLPDGVRRRGRHR
jgi:PAS domain S-box-containing protein